MDLPAQHRCSIVPPMLSSAKVNPGGSGGACSYVRGPPTAMVVVEVTPRSSTLARVPPIGIWPPSPASAAAGLPLESGLRNARKMVQNEQPRAFAPVRPALACPNSPTLSRGPAGLARSDVMDSTATTTFFPDTDCSPPFPRSSLHSPSLVAWDCDPDRLSHPNGWPSCERRRSHRPPDHHHHARRSTERLDGDGDSDSDSDKDEERFSHRRDPSSSFLDSDALDGRQAPLFEGELNG